MPGGVNTGGSRGHSSVGRASRWQREGQEFESPCLHHESPVTPGFFKFAEPIRPFSVARNFVV